MFLTLCALVMTASPADRAAFELTPALADAESVFLGSVVPKGPRFMATVAETLKGPLKPGAVVEGELDSGEEYGQGTAPRGLALVLVRGTTMRAFAAKTTPFVWAKPTLALLQGQTSLEAFQLKTQPRNTVLELLRQVFGHAAMPEPVRLAAMREVLSRVKPDWEVELMGLPPPLRLKALAPDYVKFFKSSPRSAFSSAARWVVFKELASPEAGLYLLEELEEVRVAEELNSARYVLDALEASGGGRCVFERIKQQGGMWLGREPNNRELDAELTERLKKLPAASCEATAWRSDLPLPEAKTNTDTQVRALRRLGLFGAPSFADALLTYAEGATDDAVVEAALQASARVLERQKPVDPKALDAWAERVAKQYGVRKAPALHGASQAMARLVRWQPAYLDWVMNHPTPMSGPYGRANDLLEAVVVWLDFRDAAFAEKTLKTLIKANKALVGLHQLNTAQPALVQRVMKEELAAAGTDVKKQTATLKMSARLGLDSLPLSEVAKLGKSPSAPLRAEVLQVMFAHLVGSEAYARGVPHFPLMLDGLIDDDDAVREVAGRLVSQLATKGSIEHYRALTPELAKLPGDVLERAKAASGVQRERYLAAFDGLSKQAVPKALAEERKTLK